MTPTNDPKVTVVDALMGSGKTTRAIRMMDEIATNWDNLFADGAHRFIYLTPFKAEVKRITEALGHYGSQRIAFEPKPVKGSKLNHLNAMLLEGRNCVATHSLFSYTNEETQAALEHFQYTLIIDEVAEWVERYEISSNDLDMLYAQGRLSVDPATRRVLWHEPDGGYTGEFNKLRSLCRQGKIVASRFTKGGQPLLLLWQFPVEMLRHFKQVFILTHLFDGSDMASYLHIHGVPVRKATIGRDGSLVDYDPQIEQERLDKVRPLIAVVQDRALNDIGTRTGRSYPLSKGWFDSDRRNGGKLTEKLRKNTYNFFRNKVGTPSGRNLWSTFLSQRQRLAGNGYGRSFASCNARATNAYRDRSSLAYLVNLFYHPHIEEYFKDAGAQPNEDMYALLTMTQWIWRSQVREGKPITVYIPAERMRVLFCNWLEGRLPDVPMDRRLRPSAPLIIQPVTMEDEEETLEAAKEATLYA